MSEMQLSFDQLRNDIFEGILTSLNENSGNFLLCAATYNQDPYDLILPNIETSVILGSLGSLVLSYPIPDKPKLTLTISMTLGRLNYTVQAHDEVLKIMDLDREMESLTLEAGLKFHSRRVNEGSRFELLNDGAILSAPAAINILRQAQLEIAFKEFVRLQAGRIIVGLAEILATHGVRRPASEGTYCLAVFKNLGYETEAKMILEESFQILNIDNRDSLNTVYSLRTKGYTPAPLMLCETVQQRLVDQDYRVHIEPAWGFQQTHESLKPVVVERLVVETQYVEKQAPEMDWKALIREPMLD
jgi:hypothetical protein